VKVEESSSKAVGRFKNIFEIPFGFENPLEIRVMSPLSVKLEDPENEVNVTSLIFNSQIIKAFTVDRRKSACFSWCISGYP